MKRNCSPCDRCGWTWPGSHCCIDKSDPKVRQVVITPRDLADRNKRIIRMYTNDVLSVKQIGERMGLTNRIILKVLHNARDKGVLEMRARGTRYATVDD